MLTHRSMIAAAEGQNEHLGTGPADVSLGIMPFNHVGGITCSVTSALLARSCVVLMRAFSPQDALAAMAEHRVTVAAGVPTMYSLMLGRPEFAEYDLSSVRVAIVGGANADPTLCANITKGFPSARLTNLYGLSECSGACVLSAPDDDVVRVSATLGVPAPGTSVRVVDLDGNEAGPGVEGELQISSGGVAAGYWEMPEETGETFLPGGWLATGDMVTISEDGHITLRGRLKEMFLQGGYNVYPVEVENVLTAHPGVAMAAGIGVPDAILGEVGRYYVVPRQDAPAPGEGELMAFCRERLADYKVPRQLAIVDDLPLTPAGKVAKAQLRAEFLEDA
jgi:fatty-acyl-CoA synthase